jgi:hypothetical protein
MTAKLQFFPKGNGGMRECAIRLEIVISIRICSIDPGQHILVKQCLIGVGVDPSASSEKLAMAPTKRFLASTVLLPFWALRFLPFRSFFTLKTIPSNSSKQSHKFRNG